VSRGIARTGAVVAACLLWGASFPLAKPALATIPVAHLVAWRFALGSALLATLALARGERPRRRDLPLLLATGVVAVPGVFLLQFAGLARTSVTSAALLTGTGGPLLALGGRWFRDERPGRGGWLALLVSTLGVALLVGFPGPGRSLPGDALVFLSMLAATAWVLLSARLLDRISALAVTAWSLTLGTAVMAPLAWFLAGAPRIDLPAPVALEIAGLGVGCTALAYGLWIWGLERVAVSRAAVYLNLEPLTGAALGISLLGDAATAGIVAGGALIIVTSVGLSMSGSSRRMSIGERLGGMVLHPADHRVQADDARHQAHLGHQPRHEVGRDREHAVG